MNESEYNAAAREIAQCYEDIRGKDAEIERLKAQHEEMLLKHAKDQEVCLSALDAAMKEIAVMKEIERLRSELRKAAE